METIPTRCEGAQPMIPPYRPWTDFSVDDVEGRRGYATLRVGQLVAVIEQRFPEATGLLRELESAIGDLELATEAQAVVRQGRVIAAAIAGQLTVPPGCQPSLDVDLDDEVSA